MYQAEGPVGEGRWAWRNGEQESLVQNKTGQQGQIIQVLMRCYYDWGVDPGTMGSHVSCGQHTPSAMRVQRTREDAGSQHPLTYFHSYHLISLGQELCMVLMSILMNRNLRFRGGK